MDGWMDGWTGRQVGSDKMIPPLVRMWRAGVCVIATSNRPPSDLYKDGLNRHVYLPKFEKLLNKYCKVLNLTDRHAEEAPGGNFSKFSCVFQLGI